MASPSSAKKGSLRRLKSQVMRKYKTASEQTSLWFHQKVLPKFPPRAQRYIRNFEAGFATFYENYWRFMTMPESKKLLMVTACFCIGATGFCVSC